jgi:hypothetical protein
MYISVLMSQLELALIHISLDAKMPNHYLLYVLLVSLAILYTTWVSGYWDCRYHLATFTHHAQPKQNWQQPCW